MAIYFSLPNCYFFSAAERKPWGGMDFMLRLFSFSGVLQPTVTSQTEIKLVLTNQGEN
ncbi:hypothetical protein NQU17_03525 [Clostridiaceae bacterium HFYG-1003]|nr:hypothetical protein NQU17_03525 [Clostridiaceae bacterium HFYG-1003]